MEEGDAAVTLRVVSYPGLGGLFLFTSGASL